MANQSIKDAFQRFWEYVTAKIDEQIMVVTVTKNGDTYTADKTFAEIAAKLDAGGKCEAVYVSGSSKTNLQATLHSSGYVIFTGATYTNAAAVVYVQMYEDGKIRYGSMTIQSADEAQSRYMPISGGTFTGPVIAGQQGTTGYGIRNIKYSDTAETPTTEGDICFKLK